jgi:SAM-dependent methyltransferase
MLNQLLEEIVLDKYGIEIGGPSGTGSIIYQKSNNLDNVVFSNQTIWHTHSNDYNYFPNKTGKTIINDATNITQVENEKYDFCFSSHCLEHIANPLKGLFEWLRVIKKDGYIILIVPEKSVCFDHRREITEFSTLLSQFEKNVGEDDLFSLPEILEKHDLSMDLAAGDFQNFKNRSLDNFNNRCLHHFVYSPDLLKEICTYLKCEFIYTITEDINIWFIMKKI